ncbi:unnamed protein product [Tilletia controversa]|nr:unnamed protein product [Tilletia controversa]CAD6974717.1 unnamed protein product [Tilletia controversa]
MAVIELKSLAHFEQVNTGPKKIIVYSKASWCRPCELISPLYEKLATDYASQLDFYAFDVDDADDLSEELSIRSVPTFVYPRDGAVRGQMVGSNQDKLEAFIAQTAEVE